MLLTMRPLRSIASLCAFVSVLLTCDAAKTLLLSFDGFRWDYLTRYKDVTGNFSLLQNLGATTDDGSITGTFVSKTFPSHFTIATGKLKGRAWEKIRGGERWRGERASEREREREREGQYCLR